MKNNQGKSKYQKHICRGTQLTIMEIKLLFC